MKLVLALLAAKGALFAAHPVSPALTVQVGSATQVGTGISAEGKPVALTFPDAKPANASPELLAWHGWGYLDGAKAKLPTPFVVGYDWTQVEGAIKKVPANAGSRVWHEKIVVFTRTDADVRDDNGVLQTERRTIESEALRQTEEAVARLGAWINAETDGHVRFEPEIEVEREPMRSPWSAGSDLTRGEAFGSRFATPYLEPRLNGGGYEAEDKVFRGPYNGAFWILPGALASNSPLDWVNDVPCIGVPWGSLDSPFAYGELESRLQSAWLAQVAGRLEKRLEEVKDSGGPVDWSEVTDPEPLPTATRLQRLATPSAVALFGPDHPRPTPVSAFATASTEVSLGSDPEHGQILHVAEKGVGRNGGIALAVRDDGMPIAHVEKTPTLSIQVRSTAQDPIGIEVVGAGGKSLWFSLGRDRYAVAKGGEANAAEVAFNNDGKWQHVNLDLRGLTQVAGSDAVAAILIRPTPRSILAGRIQPEPIELDLDEIKFSEEAPTPVPPARRPDSASADFEERAMFASSATASSPALLALLADKLDVVRLNVCDAYTRLSVPAGPAGLAALAADVQDIEPSVSAAALRAVAHQGGEATTLAVVQAIHHGVTEYTRETAARLLGDTKDPKYGNDIVELLADRSRLCRLASVEALANLPGREAAIRRLAFIDQTDPVIKLAVTRTCDPTDEYQMRKLLWSAVNETSDLVRAESDIKLIQSPDASFRAEGYKGVRDDSRLTRRIVLAYLIQHPSEANRSALRLAVTDRAIAVRVDALRGFASLEKGAQPEEVANVMEDRDPDVQLALIDLAKRRGLKLSDQARAAMTASPDERVRSAIKDFPGAEPASIPGPVTLVRRQNFRTFERNERLIGHFRDARGANAA